MKQTFRNLGIAAGGALLGAAAIVNSNFAERSEASVSNVADVAPDAPQLQNTRRNTAEKAKKVIRNFESTDDVSKKEKLKKQQEAEDKFVETARLINESLLEKAYKSKVISESNADGINFAVVEITVYEVITVYVSLPNLENIDSDYSYNVSYYVKGEPSSKNLKEKTFDELMEAVTGNLSTLSLD